MFARLATGLIVGLVAGSSGPAWAEPLSPVTLRWTTINVPPACRAASNNSSEMWRCGVNPDAASLFLVQLDEHVVLLDRYLAQPWTTDRVSAFMMGSFFDGWAAGATESTPDREITSTQLMQNALPPGMTGCRSYAFSRHDPAARVRIRELGLFCTRLVEAEQPPQLLVASVSFMVSEDGGRTIPPDFEARARAILATYALVAH